MSRFAAIRLARKAPSDCGFRNRFRTDEPRGAAPIRVKVGRIAVQCQFARIAKALLLARLAQIDWPLRDDVAAYRFAPMQQLHYGASRLSVDDAMARRGRRDARALRCVSVRRTALQCRFDRRCCGGIL